MRKISTLTIARLTRIAEWLEEGAPQFRMADGTYVDGFSLRAMDFIERNTVCVAGVAVAMHARSMNTLTIEQDAAQILDLDKATAEALFYTDHKYSRLQAPCVARVLRGLIAKGKVDWRLASMTEER